MKNTVFYLIISMAFMLMSCDEDNDRGQFPTDNVAPGIVTNISIENDKGFSVLTYTNPTDADLLYVEARYINSLGNEAIVRASAFTNTMELPGFLRSGKVPVEIFAVDKSLNQSESVQIEIEPLDNVMFDILGSMEYRPIFGGVGLTWENLTNKDVVIELSVREGGSFVNYENFFSTSTNGEAKSRGLDAVETEFAVVIRDEFGQRTDSFTFTTTPFLEEVIPVDVIRQLAQNPNFTNPFNTGFGSIFDGDNPDSFSIQDPNNAVGRVYFTMDLNNEMIFSRFKMFVRGDFVYTAHQPRRILLLGTNDSDIANDPESDDSSWDVIGEWYDQKPSGNDESTAPTEEDIAYFTSGMDFEVQNITSNSYRYLRFITLESWGKTNRMWLSELRFWGQLIN